MPCVNDGRPSVKLIQIVLKIAMHFVYLICLTKKSNKIVLVCQKEILIGMSDNEC